MNGTIELNITNESVKIRTRVLRIDSFLYDEYSFFTGEDSCREAQK